MVQVLSSWIQIKYTSYFRLADCRSKAQKTPIVIGALGEVIRCDFAAYPNIQRWLGNMKKLRSWSKVNEALYGYAEAVKDQPFDNA
jgi:hypothetical protein